MDVQLARRPFVLGVAAAATGVAAFLGARLHAWPPHEDETLALFVGSEPLGTLFGTVLGERGGAPLHFLLVHVAAGFSPTLTSLRLISAIFAVASIPVCAALAARLAGRRAGLVATVLVAASWVTLFHGVYGRMYSLFLFTSALAFLTLLRALERPTAGRWALCGAAAYLALASHQYGAFVLAIEVAYVAALRLRRPLPVLPALVTLAVVVVAALPMWRSNLVLASRFDVGVGGGGTQLGGPLPVLGYYHNTLADFVAGWTGLFAAVCALAALGLVVLARTARPAALLLGLVLAVPAAGLSLAHVGGSASSPETRHLIFALPFFATLVATGLVRATRSMGKPAPAVLAVAVAVLAATEIAWGWSSTPTLYRGEPPRREQAREAAADWLAATSLPDDVLFGYDPLYLGARERGAPIGDVVVPRADPKLALEALLAAPKPLGRGVWVLDASDGSRIVSNTSTRLEIPDRSPGSGFETRVFGPFLIVRTIEPTVTPLRFLLQTIDVQRLGRALWIGPSELNEQTARIALARLEGRA